MIPQTDLCVYLCLSDQAHLVLLNLRLESKPRQRLYFCPLLFIAAVVMQWCDAAHYIRL